MEVIFTQDFKQQASELKLKEAKKLQEYLDRLSATESIESMLKQDIQVLHFNNKSENLYQLKLTNNKRAIFSVSKNQILLYKIESYKSFGTFIQVKWYDVFQNISQSLCALYELNKYTASNMLFEKLNFPGFSNNHEWLYRIMDEARLGYGIVDPIHIFSSLNDNQITKTERIKRVNSLNRALGISEVDSIDFTGCPTSIERSTLSPRNLILQQEIWEFFYQVFKNSQEADIDFSMVDKWYGIQIPMLTMFLFWIDSQNFLSLDKNTMNLFVQNKMLDDVPKTYADYKRLLIHRNSQVYREIVSLAYNEKTDLILKQSSSDIVHKYASHFISVPPRKNGTLSLKSSTEFSIIALKIEDGCNPKFVKTLKPNCEYIFNNAYSISEDSIEKIKNSSDQIYGTEGLTINVSAIVGKNGTGKSTLAELIYVALNNIAFMNKHLKDKNDRIGIALEFVEDISLDLYIRVGDIFRIELRKKNITIIQYSEEEDNLFIEDEENKYDARNFELSKLFYNVCINYSQHALNSEYLGDWLDTLFHKVDSYQIPMVIEPYRDKGNIDINRQDLLAKQRLLGTILLPDSAGNSLRQLSEFYKADKLELKLDEEKFKYIYRDKKSKVEFTFADLAESCKNILPLVYKEFDAPVAKPVDFDFASNKDIKNFAQLYILKKLISISITYSNYADFFDTKSRSFNNLQEYVACLKEDKSHVTFKLRQAINFLKFPNELIAFDSDEKCRFTIESLSRVIVENLGQCNEKIIYHIPPSFFSVDIILENNIKFDSLSSGEKQKIYSIYSVIYHLYNINSVSGYLLKYQYVNVIFDEVELYFHPELQRTFISDLLGKLKQVDTSSILGVNISFITHSPFILTDIFHQNVIFLDKERGSLSIPSTKKIETFGANIHELFMNGFFLKDSIGEFSRKHVEDIINFHKRVSRATDKELELLKEEYSQKDSLFKFVQSSIAEDFLKNLINTQLIYIEDKLGHINYLSNKKKVLLEEVSRIELLMEKYNEKD